MNKQGILLVAILGCLIVAISAKMINVTVLYENETASKKFLVDDGSTLVWDLGNRFCVEYLRYGFADSRSTCPKFKLKRSILSLGMSLNLKKTLKAAGVQDGEYLVFKYD